MNCDFKHIGPSEISGLELFRCERVGCGIEAKAPIGNAINSNCTGNLRLSDGPEIIQCFIDALEIPRALAIVLYIRWRFKGSPLNELPPGIPAPAIAPKPLTDTEIAELFPGEDPTLLGNRIKALTGALGIPTCGGCEKRREWINAAHEWLRSVIPYSTDS